MREGAAAVKIAHIFFSFGVGGAEVMMRDVMNAQAVDHDVSLVIVNDNYSPAMVGELNPAIKVYKFGRPPSSLNPIFMVKLSLFLNFFNFF